MVRNTITLCCFFSFCWLNLPASGFTADAVWPQWRGARQNGVAPTGDYPTTWSNNEGVMWETPLPGRGGSTPVVAHQTAYMTAGVDGNNTLIAIDLKTGDEKWQAKLGSDAGGEHRKGSGSNPSAVVDGNFIFAYFRSGDLGCVDKSGKIVWSTNLQETYGEDTLWWDLGSSPTVTDAAVIIAVMQSGPSYLVALDKQTGDVIWKTDRMLNAPKEAAQSYSTPLVVDVDGKTMLAVMGADHITLHDAKAGSESGRLGGFNPEQDEYFRSIASPVALGNVIVCPYARGSTLTGVHLDALASGKGKDSIAWFRNDLGSDVPTPIAKDGRVYVLSDGKQTKGVITCLDLETGKTIWTVRVPRARNSFSSSPLIASNHLYATQEDGKTYVIGPLDAEQPKIVATNLVSDDKPYTVASLVPVEDGFLLRSRSRLYRIGN